MKITIDTKEDSHEEIRRAIKMLSSLVGERETFSNQPNIFDSDPPCLGDDIPSDSGGNAFSNMFGAEPITPSIEDNENTSDDEVKVEEEKEIPDIIEYH